MTGKTGSLILMSIAWCIIMAYFAKGGVFSQMNRKNPEGKIFTPAYDKEETVRITKEDNPTQFWLRWWSGLIMGFLFIAFIYFVS